MNYFFDSLDRLLQNDYIPNKEDLIRININGSGLQEYTIPFPAFTGKLVHYRALNEKRKAYQSFNEFRLIIYCVDLSEFDNGQYINDSTSTFEDTMKSQWILDKDILLVFHNKDILLERMNNFKTNHPDYLGREDFEEISNYILEKYKKKNEWRIYSQFINESSLIDIESMQKYISERIEKQFWMDYSNIL